MSLLEEANNKKPITGIKSLTTNANDSLGPDMDVWTDQGQGQHEGLQNNLLRSSGEIADSYNTGLDSSDQIDRPDQIDNRSNALGMTTPKDFSQGLSNMARNRHKETIRDLELQNKYKALESENRNIGVAFGNAANRYEIKKQADIRRTKREQTRYAARVAAMESATKIVGSIVMGAATMGMSSLIGGPAKNAIGNVSGGGAVPVSNDNMYARDTSGIG